MAKQSRTLIFNFDGTGNEPRDAQEFKNDESISNVLKLHILMGGGIKEDRTETKTREGRRQKTYYYNGIGTRENGVQLPLLGALFSAASSLINMMVAPTFGDAQKILDEALEDLEKEQYQAGDRIVLFGFSRGAALARKFASIILQKRIVKEVAFLGVFDTVSAMDGIHRKGEKISSDVIFEHGTLNAKIKRAVHLVSLDEDRISLTPTLMNRNNKKDSERILEVWFPGVHSDIGGGYWHDGLSDLCLEFMIRECKKALRDEIHITTSEKEIATLFTKQGEALEGLVADDVSIRPLLHGLLHTNSGLLTKIWQQEPRTVYVSENDKPNRRKLPILHESIGWRFLQVHDYRPASLRGLKFRLLEIDRAGKQHIKNMEGIGQLNKYFQDKQRKFAAAK